MERWPPLIRFLSAWVCLFACFATASARDGLLEFENTPVSVTALDDRSLLVADYRNLYLVEGEAARKVAVDNPNNVTFVPTDTAYDRGADELFIANYTGNDVLVGKIDPENGTSAIKRRIGDGATVSPEGIALFGDKVAIANYDGNNVQVFRKQAVDGERALCDIRVEWAHGITFADGHLFVSSLAQRKIVKIDPDTCRIVSETGSRGWGRGQFLWPTGIAAAGEKKIVVSDAHTGMLTVLRTTDFLVVQHWGGNGPSFFNMPYGVEWHDGTFYVASAFNQTIFSLKGLSWSGAKRLSADPGAWSWHKGGFTEKDEINGDDFTADYLGRTTTRIRNQCFVLGYGKIKPCWYNFLPSDLELAAQSQVGPLYFIQSVRLADGTFVFSPQNKVGLYYRDDGGAPVELHIGWDNWAVNGTIVGPDGPVALKLQQ
jgi:hypothetical protein